MTDGFVIHTILWAFSLMLIFHFLVLIKIIPYKIVWGGRLQSDKQMYQFEAVSIILNLVFILIAMEEAYASFGILNNRALNVIWWILAALFAFNTLGNVLSKNKLERVIFTPLTLILSLCSVYLALH